METPATVGDPRKLKLLVKLAINDIKYTDTGGLLTRSPRCRQPDQAHGISDFGQRQAAELALLRGWLRMNEPP